MTIYLEIVFPRAVSPGDLEIIQPATHDAPGLARLLQARLAAPLPNAPPGVRRVFSCNGRGLIGFVAGEDEPLPPYSDTYWLHEEINVAGCRAA